MLYNFLIDSHCHLKDLEEEEISADYAVNFAKNNGIFAINNVCADINDFEKILEISCKFKNVFCCIGQHPENVTEQIPTIESVVEKTKHDLVIGIGESGLDYHYCNDPDNIKLQKINFINHIEMARQSGLPLVIHSRECDNDMIDILKSEYKNQEFKMLLHSFSSGKELVKTCLDLDGYVSLSGMITFKNAENIREIVRTLPIDRLLVETDSPFLTPVPMRGKVDQPAYVKYTAKYLSELVNTTFENVQNTTTKNFFDFFEKAKKSFAMEF